METLWVVIITITGLVVPPPTATEEDKAGFEFAEVSNTSEMHFSSAEACDRVRGKMLENKAALVMGLQNPEIEISDCKVVEFTVK